MPIKGICLDCNKTTANRNGVRCRSCWIIFNKPTKEEVYTRQRNWQLYKKYGLEKGEFEAFWIVFKGKCGICNKKLLQNTKTRGQGLDTVAIDHCHKTGQIRGLLCSACNKGLGMFSDNIDKLKSAIKWLEK